MICFDITDEQKLIRQTVHEFFKKEYPPEVVREYDEQEKYPHGLFEKMADLGWTALPFPEEYGGLGGNTLDLAILLEAAAYHMLAAASTFNRSVIFGGMSLMKYGSEEQKKQLIPEIIKGKMLFAFGLTEPDAGSDALALSTTAVEDGDNYIINGTKMFCSGAEVAKYIMVVAITDKNAEKRNGLSIFLVDPNLPGVGISKIRCLGWRSTGTCEVSLGDVRVSKKQMLGNKNEGWQNIRKTLQKSRACLSAQLVGASQRIVDDAVEYAKTRVQFGRPIAKFQAIQHKLVDMQVQVDAARLLAYRVAYMDATEQRCEKEASIAKLHTSETWADVASKGMQVLGGYGYTMEYDMQRHFRDSRLCVVGEGSSEIQRIIIARLMGL